MHDANIAQVKRCALCDSSHTLLTLPVFGAWREGSGFLILHQVEALMKGVLAWGYSVPLLLLHYALEKKRKEKSTPFGDHNGSLQ